MRKRSAIIWTFRSSMRLTVFLREWDAAHLKQDLRAISSANSAKRFRISVLRTTLITGFPGETEEDHEELIEFVDEMEFDRLGVFAYSPEENTPAAAMADQVPEEVKEERRDEIMELQQEISFDKGQDTHRTGASVCMIEGKVADESAYVGTYLWGCAGVLTVIIFVQTR